MSSPIRGPFGIPRRDEIGAAQREDAAPARPRTRKPPSAAAASAARQRAAARPRAPPGRRDGQDPVLGHEPPDAAAVERAARRLFSRADQRPHRRARRSMLLVRQPQPLAQAVGILRRQHRERGEPAHRIGDARRRRPRGEAARTPPTPPRTGSVRKPCSASTRDRVDGARARRGASGARPGSAPATARASPARSRTAAARPAGSGAPARIFGMEAEEAQDAQVSPRGCGCARIADEAHAPGREIGDAAGIVVEPVPSAPTESALIGEVAPAGVGREIAAEPHHGAPAVRLDVLPQGRDLEGLALDHDRDGAVLDPGRDRLESRPPRRAAVTVRQSRSWRSRLASRVGRGARCARRRRRGGSPPRPR